MATECDTKLILVNEILIPKYLYIEPAMMFRDFLHVMTYQRRTYTSPYLHTYHFFWGGFCRFQGGQKISQSIPIGSAVTQQLSL